MSYSLESSSPEAWSNTCLCSPQARICEGQQINLRMFTELDVFVSVFETNI